MDGTDGGSGGLRGRKKAATRDAISAAALRLALEHGPGNVRVDDIAAAAGVSPRTYNNYFSSREQAIVAAVTAERALRIGAAVRARPPHEPLADAVVEAVVEQYGPRDEPNRDALLLITSAPRLRAEYIEAITAIDQPLTVAIAARLGHDAGQDDERAIPAAVVLAAAVSAATRLAIERWVGASDRPDGAGLLVVPRGDLPALLRAALAHVAPALRAAELAANDSPAARP